MKKLAIGLGVLLVALYVATVILVPPRVDRALNRVYGVTRPISPRAESLHATRTCPAHPPQARRP